MSTVLTSRPLRKLAALSGIMRPLVAGQAMLYVLLGAYLGGSAADILSARALTAGLVVGLVVACGYVVNDACDVAVDMLSRPERAIPSGRVSLSQAHVFALALAAGALAAALTLGPALALFALATIALSLTYSLALKNTVLLGNLAMALLDGSIILYGSLAVGHLPAATLVVFVLIFLYITAQEILYTLDDVEGDARSGVRTIATRWGMARALGAFRLAIIAFVAAAVLPPLLHLVPLRFLYALIPCTLVPTLALVWLVSRHPTSRNLHRVPRLMKLVWLASLIPVLLLR
ncbi:MAG TPA: UbiA family prenyltransferase [Ktedonobacterales bacterium]|jgi:geranylgeranylglycerol-phosphate geranylgeranyltransferase|nr:UbiA family prenyltransferase [Ktedonobacterales bacterium]